MPRAVLVTGAGGFLGSHLVERLVARGDQVRALVRYNSRGDRGCLEHLSPGVLAKLEVLHGDLTDPFFTRRAVDGCAVVFHLAALISIPYSYTAAAQVFLSNVQGALHVAQACLDARVGRLVHTSTSEVYGTAQRVPIAETHPLVAQSPYAASKIAADQCVQSFHRAFGLQAVTVRPFNTYGPRQSARAVLPTLITQALTRPELRVGSLHPTRDLNYVADTVEGFVLAAEASDASGAVGGTFNLATGREITMGDLAQRVLRLTGKSLPITQDPARMRPSASEVERLCGDASRAREVLGWAPAVTLDQGIARTVEYISTHLHRYRPEEYQV
ncbi:MAG: SDR family NAD(P)-dependent oxidoreductase [Deltaproteobacteria bacterium]|nr:SDR family NAD(P)-dependent oxidoreductase [Deltaproteobacteria bacterium]